MTKTAKTVSVGGFVLIMIGVGRVLYLLASRDSQGFSQASWWLTGGAVLIACIGGGLMLYVSFVRTRISHINQPASPLSRPPRWARLELTVKSPTPGPFDITGWEQLNPFLIEGQADEKMPMSYSAGDGNESLSAVNRPLARIIK